MTLLSTDGLLLLTSGTDQPTNGIDRLRSLGFYAILRRMTTAMLSARVPVERFDQVSRAACTSNTTRTAWVTRALQAALAQQARQVPRERPSAGAAQRVEDATAQNAAEALLCQAA